MNRRIVFVLAGILLVLAPWCVVAQTNNPHDQQPTLVALVANACQRFAARSVIHQPPALYSQNGVLSVRFSYQTITDSVGRQLFLLHDS
jgi:hypothetical protein